MLKKIQKQVDDSSLLPFVEEGRKRAAKRALLNSVGGLFRGGKKTALKFFSKALKLEKRNWVWPPALVCPFIILSGWNGLRVSANLYKKLPKILKQFIPFHDLETLFYRYGL